MSDRVSEFSIFSEDDYGPIGNGKQTGSSKYPITLNTNDLGSYEISNLGPCMNPKGYVSNTNCPKDNPLCNCPPELKPKDVEPTDAGLLSLKANTNECYLIKTHLSSKWFGIDYSNPKCSYNCFEETSDSGSTSASGLTGIQKYLGTRNTPTRKAFGEGATQGKTGSFWTVPGDVIGRTLDDDIVITGSSGGNSDEGLSAGVSYAGSNFKHYLEYSKTNATFWNTPKETPLYRKAQTALLTYQRIKIVVNGDFSIKPGNLVAINMPTPEMRNIEETRFAGRWMVYKNEHVITSQKHSMILYLMRDGNYHNPNQEFNINIEKQI
jgi:hypothetical protein